MQRLSKGRLVNVAILQLSILILSITVILAKKASAVSLLSVEFLAYYGLIILIMGVYAILWQQIIKKFELSVAYANKGSIIIWIFIWAVLFFQETLTINNILGALIIIIGIAIVFKDVK